MVVLLLLLHELSATFLLGAITHQALAAWVPTGKLSAGWWNSLRAVHPERYVKAVIVLFAATVVLGALIYTPFRMDVRAGYLDAQVPWATGLFEIKEHGAAIGLAMLPAYWAVWRDPQSVAGRRASATLLAVIAWMNFLVGHVVNNLRGL